MNTNRQLHLANKLRQLFHQQAREMLSKLTQVFDGAPLDLSHWNGPLVQVSTPYLTQDWLTGMVQSHQRIQTLLRNQHGQGQPLHHPPQGEGQETQKGLGRGQATRQWGRAVHAGQEGDGTDPSAARHQHKALGRGWFDLFPTSSHRDQFISGVNPVRLRGQFSAFNPRVRDAVDAAAMTFCRETNQTAVGELNQVAAKLREAFKQGLEKGEALRTLGQRVVKILADPYRAFRIAATESKRAMSGGSLLAAKDSGVVSKKRWLASSDACSECLRLSGKEVDLDEPFWVNPKGGVYAVVQTPPFHPQCLLPETPIYAPRTVGAMKTHFHGECVRIKFSDGDRLACTPNHMLLTPNGFLSAQFFVEGDDVLCCSLVDGVGGGVPNNNQRPVPISEVFTSLGESDGSTSYSVPTSPEYLHGDAAFCEGKIDVVRTGGLLGDNFNSWPQRFEQLLEPTFRRSQFGLELFGLGDLATMLRCLGLAADSSMGVHRESLALFLAHSLGRVTNTLGQERLFPSTDFDSGLFQPVVDDSSANLKVGGNLVGGLSSLVTSDDFSVVCGNAFGQFDGFGPSPQFDSEGFESVPNDPRSRVERLRQVNEAFAGKVALSKVVSVQRFHYDGPVFDVTTQTSMYLIGSGIASSNCFCDFTEVL